MSFSRYLPSAQFSVITLSLLLSGGLVYGAERIAHPRTTPAVVSAVGAPSQPSDASNWEAALYAIQAANASTSLNASDPVAVRQMLAEAQSNNLTETVGKTLLINLGNANSQGLGSDVPTQEQIIAAAQAQIKNQTTATLYTLGKLNVVADSSASLHTYGNAVLQVFTEHPAASQASTFEAIGTAVDTSSNAQLQKLTAIKAGYAALTNDLAALPVPKTLAPFHLVIVNDFVRITASYDNMQAMLADPLRGIAGFQTYQTSLAEAGKMFTSIAQNLTKNGILFTKGEPGSAWSAILSPQ